MNAIPTTIDKPQASEAWTSFAAWAADELQLRLECDGTTFRAVANEFEPAPESGTKAARKSWLLRRVKTEEVVAEPPIEEDSEAGLLAALIDRLRNRDKIAHLKPIEQPTAVHEITQKLFDAYQLDGGQVHIAGCHLEDVPFVRFTAIDSAGDEKAGVVHALFDEQGQRVDQQLVAALGLDQVEPYGQHAPRLAEDLLAELVDCSKRALGTYDEKLFANEKSVATLVWAKRVTGSLSFDFGEASVTAPFEGWARTLEPPAVVCPQTGNETFHLATIEGGEIAATHEIAVSAVTGLKRLRRDLLRCSASQKLGEEEWFVKSDVSDQHVLNDRVKTCDCCGMQAGIHEISKQGCQGCDQLVPLIAGDSRSERISAKYPRVASGKWKLSEAARSYVLIREGWLNQELLVIDKESLELISSAKRSRFSSTWRPVTG